MTFHSTRHRWSKLRMSSSKMYAISTDSMNDELPTSLKNRANSSALRLADKCGSICTPNRAWLTLRNLLLLLLTRPPLGPKPPCRWAERRCLASAPRWCPRLGGDPSVKIKSLEAAKIMKLKSARSRLYRRRFFATK